LPILKIVGLSSKNRKYSQDPRGSLALLLAARELLPNSCDSVLEHNFKCLIYSSLSKASWAKYDSGWNSLRKFYEGKNSKIVLPLCIEDFREFVVWALKNRNLKPDTVSSYLTSIALAHSLSGVDCVKFRNDKIINMCLSGAENCCLYMPQKTLRNRKAMSIHSLLLLGHKIASLDWKIASKTAVWAAATTAFFSSARLGEILPAAGNDYDPVCTLLWKYVRFVGNDRILIFIPSTKTSNTKGEVLDLFEFLPNICCPVAALKRHFIESKKRENFSMSDPVFLFESGKGLTTKIFNEVLSVLLAEICNPETDFFSCHSFRAAIPSMIANYPDKSFTKEIMDWGRWKSDSFLLYTRTVSNKRKSLFDKISVIIKNSM